MYAKDFSEPKYQFLIEKSENPGIKHLNDLKAFIGCSNTMDDVWRYWWLQPNKENKNFDCVWWYDLLVFISQFYFSVPKDARLN